MLRGVRQCVGFKPEQLEIHSRPGEGTTVTVSLPGGCAIRAQADMLRLKAFIAGLLFALLSTEAVGVVLSDRLDYQFAISITLIMSVMAAYFFMIERCAARAFAECAVERTAASAADPTTDSAS